MSFLKYRKAKKTAHEMLKHAQHIRNMREDIMTASELDSLAENERSLRIAVERKDIPAIKTAVESLSGTIDEIAPQSKGGGLRENFEILVVALAVAMGLRTYFIQPFKIPTGSMQPTLYGITSVAKDSPGLMDRYPLKLLKFVVTGKWYSERYAKSDGVLYFPPKESPSDPSVLLYSIGGKQHKIPRDAVNFYAPGKRYDLKFLPNQHVKKGDLLWSGVVTRGDHIFVNKVIWNFRKPKRGEIMVFYTTGIKTLPQGTHYIKRMCGLPNETVSIEEPNLVINGKVVDQPETIARIERKKFGYDGYQRMGNFTDNDFVWSLSDGEYFAMGDNTGNSRDSRYWGSVPERNLVGPAAFIYWPLSKRWGIAK
jgi:signal peptidase I